MAKAASQAVGESTDVPRALREVVRDAVVGQLEDGSLGAGAQVNLARLAAELNVSPTPVREALTQLQIEGILAFEKNRGFFVPKVDRQQAAETYQVLGALEAFAVRSMRKLPTEEARQLRQLNKMLANTDTIGLRAAELDRLWHARLVALCGNTVLIEEITRLRHRVSIQEIRFMRASDQRPHSVSEHNEVLILLSKGKLKDAAARIEEHWQRSVKHVLLDSGRKNRKSRM
jgi:DNA-binding GntR family transcriptional regulator